MLRVLPFLLLALVLPVPAASSQSTAEPLYLLALGEVPDHGNVTTFPSNASDPIDMPPAVTRPQENRMEWWWGVNWLPTNATIPAGSTVEVVVHLARLGLTAPTLDPTAPETVGEYRVTAHLQTGDLEPFAAGSTLLQVPPLADAATVYEVTVTFQTESDVQLPPTPDDRGESPLLRLVVGLDGSTPQGATTPVILVEAEDTPSRVHIPGFPYQAYRAAEEAEAAEAECYQRVLQQMACDPEDTGDTPTPHRAPLLGGAPGIGFLVAVAGLSAGAVVAARRILP